MTSLSFSRKLSSTAFLSHWCVVHWPTPSRVATRSRPLLSSPMACSTASRTSWGAALGDRLARSSHAASMIFCNCWVMVKGDESRFWESGPGLDKLDDALRGLQAFRRFGDQRHADAPAPRVRTMRLARQITAGQHGDIVLSQQFAREHSVVARLAIAPSGHLRPQIKTGV